MENNITKFGEALIHKFVNEEIMTKAELDNVMSKYVAHVDKRIDRFQNDMDNRIDALRADVDSRFKQVDKRFEQIDGQFERIDIRYNWILGTVLSVGIAIISAIFGAANFLSKLH